METIKPFDVVALLEDLPSRGLCRGQVGTVVEKVAPGVFEVECSDNEGRAYATLALRGDQLMALHHELVNAGSGLRVLIKAPGRRCVPICRALLTAFAFSITLFGTPTTLLPHPIQIDCLFRACYFERRE